MKKTVGLLYQESLRVVMSPWLWLAILANLLIDFFVVTFEEWGYTSIFVLDVRPELLPILTGDRGAMLDYFTYSICAFPFLGLVVEDIRSNRLPSVISKCGYLRYILVHMIMKF